MYRVFFAEDETAARDLIVNTIDWKEQGVVFCGTAGDGEEALPLILKEKPDILITDIKMPHMNGLELARLAAQQLPGLRIIIISGYSDFEYMREAIYLGVTDYVLKPVTPIKLIQAMERTTHMLDAERDRERMRSIVDRSGAQNDTKPVLNSLIENAMKSPVDEKQIRDFLNTASASGVDTFVDELLSEAADDKNPSQRVYYAYDIITAAAKTAKYMGLEPQALKEYTNAAENLGSNTDFANLLKRFFSKIIEMREAMADSKVRLVRRAQNYIDAHYADPNLSLTEAADYVGVTPNYLSQLFSRETNENFNEYLNRVRIRYAAGLLKKSDSTIQTIACETGYTDAFYFSKVFKKLMGMSPREFRKV